MTVRRLAVVAGILALVGPLEAQVRTSAFPLQRLSVSVLDATATERTCGPSRAVFTVTLSRLSWQPVVIQYATADGTALAGSDYTSVSGTLTLNPWTLSASVAVPVTADQETEPDETFFLRLTGASVRIADGEAVGTIRNNRCDDAGPCTFDRNTCSRLQTCRHVDVAACGTATCALGNCAGPDADGDGLSDAWETNGYVDLDCDGVQGVADLDLPGADPGVPDVYLEYDYMDSSATGGHSHAPAPEAAQAVVDALARQGIALHVDAAPEALPHNTVLTYDTVVATCAGSDAANFYALKAAHFDPKRAAAYHYVVFGHHNTCDPNPDPVNCPAQANCCANCAGTPSVGSGGLAELPGNDVIVSLGSIFDAALTPTVEQEAGVFLHEVGHNFGLDHAGATSTPDFKPNFLSVMNLNFAFPGIAVSDTPGATAAKPCATDADCTALEGICASTGTCTRIDYSNAALTPLNEAGGLNENVGIAAGTNDVTTYNCPDFTPAAGPGAGAIDWNCNADATETGVTADVNADGSNTSLTGFDDWAALSLPFQCTSGYADGPPPPAGLLAPEEPSVVTTARPTEPSFETLRQRHLLLPRRTVRVELRPGAPGEIGLALLGEVGFDVADVEPGSLRLAGARPIRHAFADVNADGRPDLLLAFAADGVRRAGLSVRLTGWLANSQAFSGEVEP